MAHPGGIDADYARWKTLVPFLYDWFGHHRLVWPALSCRWGAVLERGEFKHKQRLYLSEQTDGSATHPNTLVVTNVDVVKRRVAAAEHMIFEEESRSPFVKSWKKIIHPGEVNKIREFESQPNLVVTHTDAPELFVWDTDKQPHRKTGPSAADAKDERDRTGAPSKPDLVLVGHEENAEFALAVRRETFDVASGGKDAQVLLWSVADHDNGAVWRNPERPVASPTRRSSGVGARSGDFDGAAALAPRSSFRGHEDTVEDVAFHPVAESQLCSVACDRSLIFWDGRAGNGPAHRVAAAHADDLHCVDWCFLDEHAILTGSADRAVKLWDRRKLGATGDACCVHTFDAHTEGITTVQWCPDQRGVFASAAEDGYLNVWDAGKAGAPQTAEQKKTAPPSCSFSTRGTGLRCRTFSGTRWIRGPSRGCPPETVGTPCRCGA